MSNPVVSSTRPESELARESHPEQLVQPQPQPTRPESATREATHRRALLSNLAGRGAIFVLWALMIAVYGALRPNTFLTTSTMKTILTSQEPLVFLGLALVCVFVVGEFDLSVASIMGLAATTVAVLNINQHVNIVLACLVAIVVSAVIGLVNGWLIVSLGIDAIVVTLGMSTFLLGIALKISNLQTISGLSDSFAKISNTSVGGLSVSFYYGIALALFMGYLLTFTPLGRHMAFVGANREVARLAGVRVNRIRIGAYVTSGAICGVGGVLLVSSVGGFDPSSSPSYLLPAFSAAFLGTAALVPGHFNPLGTVVAIYFLATGILGLQLLGYTGWISNVFYGAALVIAVTVSTLVRRRTSLR